MWMNTKLLYNNQVYVMNSKLLYNNQVHVYEYEITI